MNRLYLPALLSGFIGLLLPLASLHAQSNSWVKHVVYEGEHCNTAVAGDFTGDGQVDVICNAGGETLLLVAPGWEQIPIGQETGLNLIHGEVMDVEGNKVRAEIGNPLVIHQYSKPRVVSHEKGHIPILAKPEKEILPRKKVRGIRALPHYLSSLVGGA